MKNMPVSPTVMFTEEDMQLFANASHDASWLHMNEEYARRTAFGERIIFGGLGVLACLRHLPPRDGQRIKQIEVEYLQPMFVGVNYSIIQMSGNRSEEWVFGLLHGQEVMARVSVSFGKAEGGFDIDWEADEREPLRQMVDRSAEDFARPIEATGMYCTDLTSYDKLLAKWGIQHGALQPLHFDLILFFSYLSGMVLPGKKGMSAGYKICFLQTPSTIHQEITFKAVTRHFDAHYGLLTVDVQAGHANGLRIEGELKAFLRKEIEHENPADIEALLGADDGFHQGKTALIVGGSRGLGAALTQALALRGCHLFLNYSVSQEMARSLQARLEGATGTITLLPGDASDPQWAQAARETIENAHGRLDYLICAASIPVFGRAALLKGVDRERAVAKSLQLVQNPVETFADLLQQHEGTVIALSAEQLAEPGKDSLLHEIKTRTEEYVSDAAGRYPRASFVVFRLPKMITDMNNTPMSLMGAQSPGSVAARIVNRLAARTDAKSLSILTLDAELEREAVEEEQKDMIALTATFVTEPLVPGLRFWQQTLHWPPLEVTPSGYNQVFQDLLDPNGLLLQNRSGMNAILLKVDDWLRYLPQDVQTEAERAEYLDQTVQQFIDALTAYQRQASSHTVVLVCPSLQDVTAQEAKLLAGTRELRGIEVVRVEDYHERYGIHDVFDAIRDQLGHIPYTETYYHFLSTLIARRYDALRRQPYKVIVVDCDNTIWDGVAGEAGPKGVKIEGAFEEFQRFLVQKSQEGFLICLCSKNEEPDVWNVFEQQPDMPLRREHIVDWRINWTAKSENIRSLAASLQLGLDSFVFIDDNPVECAEVRANCPEVLVVQDVKSIEDSAVHWDHFWALDNFAVTAEDKKRTRMYQENVSREKLRQEAVDFASFLASLNLQIDIQPVTEAVMPRVAQLVARTNQFNVSSIRRTQREIEQMIEQENYGCLTVEVRDKFGDYGLVGVVMYKTDEECLTVDTLLLSCRVLGRGVEYRMLARLGELAKEQGAKDVRVLFRPTERNRPAMEFLDRIGADNKQTLDGDTYYVYPAEELQNVQWVISDENEAGDAADKDESKAKAQAAAPTRRERITKREALFTEIAKRYSDMAFLSKQIARFEQNGTAPDLSEQPASALGEPVTASDFTADPAADGTAAAFDSVLDRVKTVLADYLHLSPGELDVDGPLVTYIDSSMKIINATVVLNKEFGQVPPTLLFEHTSIRSVAQFLFEQGHGDVGDVVRTEPVRQTSKPAAAERPKTKRQPTPQTSSGALTCRPSQGAEADIAIIGMHAKFPGADTLDDFWANLKGNICSISEIPADRWSIGRYYDPTGQDPTKSHSKWGGFIQNVDKFDAAFFHISPKEAELMDPQQRLFLEVVWGLLEDAGYTDQTIDRKTGVFVGMVSNDYGLLANQAALRGRGAYRGTDYYQVPNRISYFFDLHGPSMAIDTACASSGTAIALACEALKKGECNYAIVGGINLFLHPSRYVQYSRMKMLAPEAKCRPFGAGAQGTIFGEGIGAILLKRLPDAERDKDNIHGVIKGYAINSGGKTNGFTVPNPNAHAELIRAALDKGHVDPATISYVEAHGTGTPLGDPIEVRGLTMAYDQYAKDHNRTPGRQYCAIGSVKGNIGHLESGAALSSLIKVLLQMKHKTLVKSLHTEELNPSIDFTQTPFFVQQHNAPWQSPHPLRAGISSFGAGGSCSHMIVEEYVKPVINEWKGDEQLFVFSAKTEDSLRAYVQKFVRFLEKGHIGGTLADMAYTLQTGRRAMEERLAVTADSIAALQEALTRYLDGSDDARLCKGTIKKDKTALHFLLDGQEGRDFVARAIETRKLDKVARMWTEGLDIEWELLYPEERPARISLPTYAFRGKRHWIDETMFEATDAPLSSMLDRIAPGMSLGQGLVFEKTFRSLDRVLQDHKVRGSAILPGVGYAEMLHQAASYIYGETKRFQLTGMVWLQPLAVRSALQVRLAVQEENGGLHFELTSEQNGQITTHCKATAAMLNGGTAQEQLPLETIRARCTKLIEKSTLYKHFRKTGIQYGPYYQALEMLQTNDEEAFGRIVLPDVYHGELKRHALHPSVADAALQAVQWLGNQGFGEGASALLPFSAECIEVRAPLGANSYVYAKKIGPGRFHVSITDEQGCVAVSFEDLCLREAKDGLSDFFYRPRWEAVPSQEYAVQTDERRKRIFIVGSEEAEPMRRALHQLHRNDLVIDYTLEEDGSRSFQDADTVYFLAITDQELAESLPERQAVALFRTFKALSRDEAMNPGLAIKVVTNNVFAVRSGEKTRPVSGALYGLTKSMIKEYPYVDVSLLDIDGQELANASRAIRVAQMIAAEPALKQDIDIALRDGLRYERRMEAIQLPAVSETPFRPNGVYAILGGAGGIGIELARYLAEQSGARVALIGRSELSPEKKSRLAEVEEAGGEVLYVQADALNLVSLKEAVRQVKARFGALHGVIHSAIVLHDKSMERMDEAQFMEALLPKTAGSMNLYEAVKDEPLDFMLFFSSTQAFASNPGQCNYAAGCTFKDAFARHLQEVAPFPVKIVNWGYWGNVGIVANEAYNKRLASMGYYSIEPHEGMEALTRIIGHPIDQAMAGKFSAGVLTQMGADLSKQVKLLPARYPSLLDDSFAMPEPTEAERLALTAFLKGFRELEGMERLGLLQAFQALGVFHSSEERLDVAAIERRLQLAQEHKMLLPCLLDALVQSGYVIRHDDCYSVDPLWSHPSVDLYREEIERMEQRLYVMYPNLRAHTALVKACVDNYVDVLTGKVPATDILFPESSMRMVEGIFKGNDNADTCNRLVANNLLKFIERRLPLLREGEKIKILEVGAGTGGTSAGVLRAIQKYGAHLEYTYTDISHAFLRHGRKEYGVLYPFMDFKILNIEQDVEEQGFVPGTFDVILATNVLHATSSIMNTMSNVQSLLQANGWLIMNEITDVLDFDTLTFGLLKGWWLFVDPELRLPGSPLLAIHQWMDVFREIGYKRVVVSSSDLGAGERMFQHVFVAEGSGHVRVQKKQMPLESVKQPQEQKSAPEPTVLRTTVKKKKAKPKSAIKRVEKRTETRTVARKPDSKTFIQQKIVAGICDSLGTEASEIDFDKPFSEYGVDSILAVELISYINRSFGIVVRTTVLFDYSTVNDLTRFLESQYGQAISDLLSTMEEEVAVTEEVEVEVEVEDEEYEEVDAYEEVEEYEEEEHEQDLADRKSGHGVVYAQQEQVAAATEVLVPTATIEKLPHEPSVRATGERAVTLERPGTIDQILLRDVEPQPPGADDVQIAVRAFSLNFADLLCAKGLYPNAPDYPFVPGFEVSGVITAVGANVREYRVGDEVIALAGPKMGGQTTTLTVPSWLAIRKPANVSFEEACAFPIVFLTMYLAFEKANVQRGDNILIQTAAGGTGLIAVQLAQLAGANIFATAGSEVKLDYLRKMGVPHVIDYLKEDFAKKTLELTNGYGVDVVINTLSGDYIQKGIDLLAPEGRYIEIAMAGLKAQKNLDLSRLVDNQVLYSVDLSKVLYKNPETTRRYLTKMVEYLQQGTVKPTIGKVFPLEQIRDAYRYMEQRHNIGKVVVTVAGKERPDSTNFRSMTAEPASTAAPLAWFQTGTPPSAPSSAASIPSASPQSGCFQNRDIAVIGLSGRFSGSGNADEFWQNIAQGKNLIRKVPKERWDIDQYYDPDPTKPNKTQSQWGGFIDGIDMFDPLFFNMSGAEAELADPVQRLFLEECYHALEDAGYAGPALGKTSCGVFAGVGKGDYYLRLSKQQTDIEAHTFVGNEPSIVPARIAYYLNLKGPAVAIDTACSSSLVAVHLACQSILAGDCEMAIAGGAFLLTSPDFYILCSKTGMLSPDGICKTFDNEANGFVPGEGVGAIILKPLDAALRDGDHIYGVIKGSGINQDGKTNGITAPSTLSQTELEKAVYAKAGVHPEQITYIETHGTGTKLGDPIEIDALTAAFRASTDKTRFCAIGSVKTNIGHASQGAGIANVIKVLLAMKHGQLPPSLHYRQPNEHIDFANSPFYVNTELKPWVAGPGGLRTAAVSAFGMSGTNAHLVLQEAPAQARTRGAQATKPAYLIPLSAKSERALKRKMQDLVAWLEAEGRSARLADIAFTLHMGRQHFNVREAFVASDAQELLASLRAALSRETVGKHPADSLLPAHGQQLLDELDSRDYRATLEELAKYYVQRVDLSWSKLYEDGGCLRIPLPKYPYEKERYWADRQGGVSAERLAVNALHPLLDANASTLNEQSFVKRFNGSEYYLTDHLVKQRKVLPGVCYLEMAMAAAELSGAPVRKMENIVWAKPIVHDDAPLDVYVCLRPQAEKITFEIGTVDAGGQRDLHSQGDLVSQSGSPAGERFDLDEMKRRMHKVMDRERCYAAYRSNGLVYGPRFQVIEELYGNGQEALARLRLAEPSREYLLQPALLDGTLQTILGLLNENEIRSGTPYLPYALGELEVFGPVPSECYAYARVSGQPHAVGRKFDLRLLDGAGRTVLRLTDYFCKTGAAREEALNLFDVQWEANEIAGTAQEDLQLIVFENTGVLAGQLARRGGRQPVIVQAGEAFVKRDAYSYVIRAHEPDDYLRLLQEVQANGVFPSHMAYLWDEGTAPGVYALLSLSQALAKQKLSRPLRLVSIVSEACPFQGAQAGFMKSLYQENPNFLFTTLIVNETATLADCVLTELSTQVEGGTEVRYSQGARSVKRARPVVMSAEEMPLRNNGVYLLTGGAGGIGLTLAETFASRFSGTLVLAGRSKLSADKLEKLERIRAMGCAVEYLRSDLSDAEETKNLIRHITSSYGTLNGIFHCAGVLRDSFMMHKTVEEVRAVLAPKVDGTLNLDEATKDVRLDFFCLFSSMASVTGNVGQCDYAYANAFMDHFARLREAKREQGQRFGKTLAVNWPLWKDGGMTIDRQTEERFLKDWGMAALTTDNAVRALAFGLTRPEHQLIVVEGNTQRIREALGLGKDTAAKAPQQTVVEAAMDEGSEERLKERTESYLKGILSRVTKLPAEKIEAEEPLEAYGIDSMMVMSLTNELERDFTKLSRTLFFEYQTLSELADYFVQNHRGKMIALTGVDQGKDQSAVRVKNEGPRDGAVQSERHPDLADVTAFVQPVAATETMALRPRDDRKSAPVEPTPSTADFPVAIVGLSGRYPDANDLDTFWKNLSEGKDSIREISLERWDHSKYFDPEKGKPGKSYAKWGGFLDGVDEFDPLFFQIMPKEAELLDPQERLFLETVWSAVEDAGYTRKTLSGQKVGVYVGVMYSHYQLFGAEEMMKGHNIAPSASYASIANRISYHFNFQGPSMAVDTMCSSSLTAIHLACESMRRGEIDAAIAGGVNLSIHPAKYIMLSQGRFASTDGRCRSFGEGGDGYVPGEGVGAVLLKPLHRAIEDGDHIYGVVRGTSINHGGKTNGYTVPNPKAQAALIREALKNANVEPHEISYIEAHGTGTSLGDPIEIAGLTAAFGQGDSATPYCAIGSVKSNIGHLESAAGIAGVTKVLLQMKHKQLVPSLHAEVLNPNIDFDSTPFYVQRRLDDWNVGHRPRIAGISSFGAGGSNAHVILEEYEAQSSGTSDNGPQLIVLSAKTRERLQSYARKMADGLERRLAEHASRGAGEETVDAIRQEIMRTASFQLEIDASELEEEIEECGIDAGGLSLLAQRLSEFYEIDIEPGLLLEAETWSRTAQELARRLRDAGRLEASIPELSLADIAYTLQVGREAMEERLAFVAHDVQDMITGLRSYAEGRAEGPCHFETAAAEEGNRQRKEGVEAALLERLFRQKDWAQLAELWVGGVDVRWEHLYHGQRRKRIPLPTYPFARERYWLPISSQADWTAGRAALHPVLDSNCSTLQEQCLDKTWTPSDAFVRDHLVNGKPILPGAVLLEMARAAGDVSNREAAVTQLKRIVWQQSLTVTEPVRIEISLVPGPSGVNYAVRSAGGVVHGQGMVVYGDPLPARPRERDLTTLEREGFLLQEKESWYQRLGGTGLHYGPSLQAVERVYRCADAVVARLRLPQAMQDKAFVLHPTLIDGAMQTVGGYLEAEKGKPYLPIGIETVEIHGSLPDEVLVHVRPSESGTERVSGVRAFDIRITDLSGHVLVVLEKLLVKQPGDRDRSSSIRVMYMQEVWEMEDEEVDERARNDERIVHNR
jgi:FkbH-like protein